MLIRLAVAVLFVGLFSIVPLMGAMDVSQAEKGPATIAEQPPVSTCRWKTYTSKTYGFEIRYPQDLAVQERMPLAVIEGAVIRLSLVDSAYYDGTNLVEASLFVGITPEQACSFEWPPDASQNSSERGELAETREIAGITFYRASSWEGAVGNQYGLIRYSALHGGSRYRLALFIHSINIHVFYPQTVAEFDRTTVLRLFDQVISTFRFLK